MAEMTIATKVSFADALDRLRYAQKSAKGAPAYSRFVNRPVGKYLAAAAYRSHLTPNQVTGLSALFTFGGIGTIVFARPTPLVGPIVCLLLVVGYALDSADGQLARLRGGGSAAGEWLDHVIDAAKISSLHLAVLVAAYRHFDLPHVYLLVPIGFTVVAAVMFFTIILNDQLRRRHSQTGDNAPNGVGHSAVRSILVIPTDYGLLCLSFLLFGFPMVFSVSYGLLFVANTAFLSAALVKWFRDMSALEPARKVSAPATLEPVLQVKTPAAPVPAHAVSDRSETA